MSRNILIVILFLLIISSVTPIVFGYNIRISKEEQTSLLNRGNTLYVGGSGPNNYTKIQNAINDANPGDTVFVYNGTYYENVNVDKTINLIGEDRNITIIDGGGSNDVIYVTDGWVNISGFTIQNSGTKNKPNDSGVEIISNNTCIEYNIIHMNHIGIKLYYSNYNTIKDNIIVLNNRDGIDMERSDDNIIINNNISNNSNSGIFLYRSSNYNSIIDNNFSNNSYAGVMNCNSYNTIIGNNFYNDGLFVFDAYHTNASNNTINGKPLVYLEKETDTIIDVEAGQVILVRCDNITVKNQELYNTVLVLFYGILTIA